MEERRSRRSLLAAAGAATLLVGCGGTDAGPARDANADENTIAPGDLDIVAFALMLEYFEAAYYGRLVEEKLLRGRDQELVKGIAANEAAHVDALEAVLKPLGGKLPERPRPDFATLFAGRPDEILGRAAEIENVGPAAYLGQASRIQSDGILSAALSIHAIEARQAAVLNYRVGRAFVPDGALASPLSKEAVLERVQGFIL